jgi:hypothetical protein
MIVEAKKQTMDTTDNFARLIYRAPLFWSSAWSSTGDLSARSEIDMIVALAFDANRGGHILGAKTVVNG